MVLICHFKNGMICKMIFKKSFKPLTPPAPHPPHPHLPIKNLIKLPNLIFNSVDGLIRSGARTSAGRVMTKFGSRARFLSPARTKLRLCSVNHWPGYLSNLACDWPSTAWAYSEQETKNGARSVISSIDIQLVIDIQLIMTELFKTPFWLRLHY